MTTICSLNLIREALTKELDIFYSKDALCKCTAFKRTLLNHGLLVDGLDDMVVFVVVVVTQKRDKFIP